MQGVKREIFVAAEVGRHEEHQLIGIGQNMGFSSIPVFTDDGDTCTVLTYGGRKPKPYMNC